MDLLVEALFVVAVCLGLGAFFLGLAFAAWFVHRVRPAGKLRSRLTRGLQRIQRLLSRIDHERARREARLDGDTRTWIAAQALERQREVPIEDLRVHGANRVRWSDLREAGYRSLHDVAGLSVRQLEAVKGVGETGAERVEEAARELVLLLAAEPPRLPGPEFTEEGALDAGRAALECLLFRDGLGPEYPRVWRRHAELAEAFADLRGALSLWSWLLGPLSGGRRARNADALVRGAALAGDLQALDGHELKALEQYLPIAKRAKAPAERKDDGEALRAALRPRHAEICAVLERSLRRLGLASPESGLGIRGGLPREIVARVEELELAGSLEGIELRAYQSFGAKYLLAQRRTILGDEMGLGKTIEALAAMAHVEAEEPGAHFLVVAPAGLVWNWQREIERRAPFDAHVVHGDLAEASLERWRATGGVAVTSYATLRNLELGGDALGDGRRIDFLVADEAHYLKNPEARRTKATRALVDRSERVALLTGTPLENHPREFVHLIRTVQPTVVAELEREGLSAESTAHARTFHRHAAGVYLRRNQRDVLAELPERIEVEEWVELEDPEERARYDALVRAGDFMGMRRATTAQAGGLAPSKAELLDELLEDHRESGRKVIAFSFFLDVLAALEKRFDVHGTISGSVPPDERMAIVDRFSEADGHALLAIQIDAGGTGLNLQAASAVVLMEPQLKPTTEAQAIARAHRMGQTERVVVHRLLARDTVDARLAELLDEKSALFDAFARESATGRASEEVREASLARLLIEDERARLTGAQGVAGSGSASAAS